MSDASELLRLRDKAHALEKAVWLADALAKQAARNAGANRRELRELAHRVDELAEQLEAMTAAEELERAVTAAITSERRGRWTLPRRLASGVAALILLVPALHDLATWL